MILISACLAGIPCRYDGKASLADIAQKLVTDKKAIYVCPEVSGGLSTPRDPAEIVGGSGEDVLDGKAKVITKLGEDVTEQFISGANHTLQLAKKVGATMVILKENSPSCGSSFIYDGHFQGKKVSGDGVTSALLKRHGFRVGSEHDLYE
ncbi:DUF523 domain-containing protein [Thermoactinomyces sp. DSM 45892]|uniref:DUF523 domain-containing protein n=1 Tax=Thermoactinomyces sp. DSM 45892 TaxID=1882753 RepID=UPI00089C5AE6|nr:DUF523 domain-containing protein [Thermoactinomyces sp. DSM 45892]SDZ17683.1 Uncharacterized conserved protein YbbK, DUF523 family [Thermoactinomyces sp. DSM 45892]